MKYKTILWLNFASLIEAFIIKVLIDYKIVVCNFGGLHNLYDMIAMVSVKNMLVLGGYQMYFWPQKNHKLHKKIYLVPTLLDKRIPAIPELFWIYSPLYYVFFSLAILCLKNYNSSALHAWLMLMHSSFWFVHFPTGIRKEFREKVRGVPTDKVTKFIMDLVHDHDTEDNACPSMHCAFAVFLAFITYPFYPTLSIAFPIIVSLSCLFTKQHLIVDIVPGFLLGALHGFINMSLS
ncbi:hypothetical protein Aasi_0709 [Candidatus Amoebophilus asiaticus 5a2]|uniref:Phosphatidic acid phosphatase type 2/haloperoxidase domain-containing protein n=1 Tax=Amoebophilus asiaticus (strain 5a2) TaxID=452471 RepID=B3ES94_AMOA5|nr:phosphatase PAP2 family protein [Candidatus Amoebophilus asiaticus]ACE06096.1 hypothetical protein Aasi_0709 [Candidatus Amoebophilus asiaticus 5a2]